MPLLTMRREHTASRFESDVAHSLPVTTRFGAERVIRLDGTLASRTIESKSASRTARWSESLA